MTGAPRYEWLKVSAAIATVFALLIAAIGSFFTLRTEVLGLRRDVQEIKATIIRMDKKLETKVDK